MHVEPGAFLGPYQVLSLIGRGGMGEVYRALDPRLGREVAIKTVAAQLAGDATAIARFEREARIVAALSHPSILAIYDIGTLDDGLFLVTELLQGETLGQRLSRGPLPWPDAIDVAAAVADGLASAHEQSVVHRDLKPDNVFLTDGGRVKILDFGLARDVNAAADPFEAVTRSWRTEPGLIVGTVAYMSPEQVKGERLDARSDIFSLGCVLFEMLAGRPLLARTTVAESIAALLTEAAPALSASGVQVPGDLDRLVLRCLEKDPERRFQTTRDLAAALGRIAAGSAPLPAVVEQASVAVLPFVSLGADPDNECFADGITEDVIAHLSKIRVLKVISRTSVMAFKQREQSVRQIGQQLGASTVLEGSVRRAGNRVRIVAQLVDTRDERHVWAETYDRELTDIFAIQTDVALRIAEALRAELSLDERDRIGRQPTRDLEAYTTYLQGRHAFIQFTAAGIRQSLVFFEQAIARDPAFALAHAAMAASYVQIGIEGLGPLTALEAYALGKQCVTRALTLDAQLAEAHGIAGLLLFVSDFEWDAGERELRLALALSPGYADAYDHLGWLCSAVGRHDEALAALKRARELDPLAHRSDVASELLRGGRFDEARDEAGHLLEAEPGYARGHALYGWALVKLGRGEEGVAALERAVSLAPGLTLFLGQLGQAYAMTGATERARAILQQLHERAAHDAVSPYHFAYVYTGLGDAEAALDWLERGYEQRSGAVYGMKGSFLFTSLHSHPRFRTLLKKMNLA